VAAAAFLLAPDGRFTNLFGIEDNTGIPTGKDKNATPRQKRHYLCTMCALGGGWCGDERFENRSYVGAHNKIGNLVEIRGFAIDNDECCAAALRKQRKSRRGPNHERRTNRNQ
jgi:hypothetical protein